MTEYSDCHGPGCSKAVNDRSPSPFFCSQICHDRWQAQWGKEHTVPLVDGVTVAASNRATITVTFNSTGDAVRQLGDIAAAAADPGEAQRDWLSRWFGRHR